MIFCFTDKEDSAATPSSEIKAQKIQSEKHTIPVVTVKLKDSSTIKTDVQGSDEKVQDANLDEKDALKNQNQETDEKIQINSNLVN